MSEENNLTNETDELLPASHKTKEEWLHEGNVLSFYSPIRYEEGLAAYEQAISLDATDTQAYTGKGDTLYDLKRYEEALMSNELERSQEAQQAYDKAKLLDSG